MSMRKIFFLNHEVYIEKVLIWFYMYISYLLCTPMTLRPLDVNKYRFRIWLKNEELIDSEVSYFSSIWRQHITLFIVHILIFNFITFNMQVICPILVTKFNTTRVK